MNLSIGLHSAGADGVADILTHSDRDLYRQKNSREEVSLEKLDAHLEDPELAIFSVAGKLLPPFITGIVMAGIMVAIMPTADSIILQTGTIASRDIYQRFFNKKADDKQMVMLLRMLVLVMGVIGYIIALVQPPGVFAIVVFTTSVLGSAFLPVYVCAVWWKKANTPGAIASMIGGAAIAFLWKVAGIGEATAIHPMFAGLIASIVLMIVVSLTT